jgi:hypothetical protein
VLSWNACGVDEEKGMGNTSFDTEDASVVMNLAVELAKI